MGRYDNENVIISEARSVPTKQTCFLTKSPFERNLYRAVIKEWPKWTINRRVRQSSQQYKVAGKWRQSIPVH